MSAATVLSVISAVFGLLKLLVGYADRQKMMEAGAAQAVLKGIDDAERSITEARNARAAVRDKHMRDPSSVLSDDEFKRPD